jgi:hypothetical protein
MHKQPGQLDTIIHDPEEQDDQEAKDQIPSHSFITIVSAVRINSDHLAEDQLAYGQWSKPGIHNLISSSKAPSLLLKYP